MAICCSFKSYAGGTCGFGYREDRSCKSQFVPLHCCKKDISCHLRSCKFSDPENKVDLILSRAGIFETLTDIDVLQFAPLIDVGWSRGSNSRCRVLKEVSGHCKGRVNSIPKADGGIGKRVSQIVLEISGKSIQPGSEKTLRGSRRCLMLLHPTSLRHLHLGILYKGIFISLFVVIDLLLLVDKLSNLCCMAAIPQKVMCKCRHTVLFIMSVFCSFFILEH